MGVFFNGAPVPPPDASSLDGITANLQPAGAGQDGYVVTFNDENNDLELAPSSGGFANPMTAVGDTIVGGVAGAATRLAAGATGFVYRIVGGTPVWRGLCAEGTGAARPAAAEQYVGQWYWSNDASAGLELSVCIYEGGVTFAWVTIPYAVTAPGVALIQAANVPAQRTALGLGGAAVLDVGTIAGTVAAGDADVPKTTTVNGHALSGDVVVTPADVGLGAVTATGADAAAARAAIGAGEDAMPSVRTLAGLCLPAGLTDATLWLDEAQIPRVASGTTLTSWPARIGASAGSPAGAAVKVRVTNGLYEAAWETRTGSLACAMNPGSGATPRTLVVVALAIPFGAASQTSHVLHYGNTVANQAYGVTCQRSTAFFWGNHYWSTFPDSTAVPTTAAQCYINAYDGAVDHFYFNGATAGTFTVALNTGSGGSLYLGSRIAGPNEGWLGSLRLVLVYPRCLSATEVATLQAWLALRGLV